MDALRKAAGFILAIALVGAGLMYLTALLQGVFTSNGYEFLLGLAAGIVAFGWLARGPFGRAIARLLGEQPEALPKELPIEYFELDDQVQALKAEIQRIGELEERLDFAERLLVRKTDADSETSG